MNFLAANGKDFFFDKSFLYQNYYLLIQNANLLTKFGNSGHSAGLKSRSRKNCSTYKEDTEKWFVMNILW